MAEKTLEFRGIPLNHLIGYVEELGASQSTDEFPIIFEGKGWQAVILREEEVPITSTFRVNAVHIRFQAEAESAVESLIARFRKKTFRAGG